MAKNGHALADASNKTRMTDLEFAEHMKTLTPDDLEFYDWLRASGRDPQELVPVTDLIRLSVEYTDSRKREKMSNNSEGVCQNSTQ